MIANFNQLPEYLYHATLFSDLASIQENGLGCVDNNNYDDPVYNQKGFFISFDCGDAFEYLNAANDARDIVVLEIPKKIMIGLAIGKIMLLKILKWLAPSILAASSKLFGMVSI